MSKLKVYRSPEFLEQEAKKIEKLVKQLYVAQGLYNDKESINFITDQLLKKDYDFKRLEKALDKLYVQELSSITLKLIIETVEEMPRFIEEKISCPYCQDSSKMPTGYVFGRFQSDDGYVSNLSLACCCETGERIAKKNNMRQWDGKHIKFKFNTRYGLGVLELDIRGYEADNQKIAK